MKGVLRKSRPNKESNNFRMLPFSHSKLIISLVLEKFSMPNYWGVKEAKKPILKNQMQKMYFN